MPGFAVPAHLAFVSPSSIEPLSTAGPTGYSPAQIRHAYGFDKIAFANGAIVGDGSGTTIAIVDAYDDPNIASDLHQFDLKFGLPDPVFSKVNQTGGTAPPAADGGWASEIALDVEWAHAIAPKAKILLVEARDASMSNLMAAVDYARRAVGVVAVSMSWGGGEFFGETVYDSYFTTPAGHSGVTFLASSGDSGAPVGYPAASPNVVAVGGTALYLDSQGNYISETGWSGSGGGLSGVESQPAYQNGVVTQSASRRANPDVSYDSSPNTGFPVYDSYNNPVSSPWSQFGGTSAASPQWAALVAIADQGLALAGKSALDGATQLLPLLYSLPRSDFHDVSSGLSTGRPTYSAGPGYDLVAGLGTPYANLVVGDLVGTNLAPPTPSATHFAIAAASSTTAGATFSITVSALDSSNSAMADYVGTIHFSSSDTSIAAVLPYDYTFAASDHGVRTFAGVRLATAGSQTISVTDTNSGLLTGSAALTVDPAVADHLAFGRQPSSGSIGAVISPAVTVRVLDAYDNLVTTDYSDQVAVLLGSNPGAGVLGGTTTATTNGGVASFGNLSLDRPGVGYTLVATSGAMKSVTSAGFNVVVATPAIIEDFEGSRSYNVAGGRRATAAISTIAAHDMSYGLLDYAGNDWIYRNDSTVQVKQGDTISVWLRFQGAADGRAYFGFGASPGGTLSLVAAPNTGQLLIQDNRGYGFVDLGSAPQTWKANHWYRLEVQWGAGGSIVGKLYDSNGATLLQTVQATTSAITSGGIGFRASGFSSKNWDTVLVTRGVNSVAAKAVAGTDHAAFYAAVDEAVRQLTQTTASAESSPGPSFAPATSPDPFGTADSVFGKQPGDDARRRAGADPAEPAVVKAHDHAFQRMAATAPSSNDSHFEDAEFDGSWWRARSESSVVSWREFALNARPSRQASHR